MKTKLKILMEKLNGHKNIIKTKTSHTIKI